jgi:hypothetical protein
MTGRKVTVKQALAAAGLDMNRLANMEVVLIRRAQGDKETVTRMNPVALFGGTEADRYLQANDIGVLKEITNRAAAAQAAATEAASVPTAGAWRAAFAATYGLKEGERVTSFGQDLTRWRVPRSV